MTHTSILTIINPAGGGFGVHQSSRYGLAGAHCFAYNNAVAVLGRGGIGGL